MSSVRMCDYMVKQNRVCGTIFSEQEIGWSTGVITTVGEDGKALTVAADFCPDHAPSAERSKVQIPRFTPNVIPDALPSPTSTTRATDDPWAEPESIGTESSGGH